HVLTERGLREVRVRLQLQLALDGRRVEALDLDVKGRDGRGRAGADVEEDGGARAGRVELPGGGDLGAVEAAVAQVGLEGVGVLAQQLVAQALAGLEQGDARAQLVLGYL